MGFSKVKAMTGDGNLDRIIDQLQSNIATAIRPLLNDPLNNGQILTNYLLGIGLNVIPHGLGRNLQGWFMTRVRTDAAFYDTQDSNPTPAMNLFLNSSAIVKVDIFVF